MKFPELEVSEREPCEMCGGAGRVMCTPGRGEPYEVTCEYCGGCGKMGIFGYPCYHDPLAGKEDAQP
jgi:hypothetical protein